MIGYPYEYLDKNIFFYYRLFENYTITKVTNIYNEKYNDIFKN
jgi:hypothetical protein